jgi:hypothetical protein
LSDVPQKIRQKSQELTVEKLRTYPGLDNLTNEEAQEIIFSLNSFACLLCEIFIKEQKDQNKDSAAEYR